jgi:hypothetical protein
MTKQRNLSLVFSHQCHSLDAKNIELGEIRSSSKMLLIGLIGPEMILVMLHHQQLVTDSNPVNKTPPLAIT